MESSLAWLQRNGRHVVCWSIANERAAHLQPFPSPWFPRRKTMQSSILPWRKQYRRVKTEAQLGRRSKSELDQAKPRVTKPVQCEVYG